jgi:hypothetical protein
MDSELIKDILKQATDLYEEIYKNSNDISCLLNIDCINFNKNETEINLLKNIFCDNIDLFIIYLTSVSFSDITESTFNQLSDILKSDILSIIDIKNLYCNEKRDFLNKIEKEIYLYCYDKFNETYTYNKLEFFNEFNNFTYLNNFIEKMKFHNENRNNELEQYNFNYIENNKPDDDIKNEEIENIINQYNSDKLFILKIEDMEYTFWNKNVLLYKFTDIKTRDYKYIYFDLFKRKDKNQKDSIIKFNNNKGFIICLNSYNISDKLKKSIDILLF